VRAAVPFYGVVPWEGAQPDYSALTGAVLGHFAELDHSASPEAARALGQTLKDSGNVDVELHVYPGVDHAFFNDTRPEVYDAEASALAWQRTIQFLHSRIG
jgi:carboxymethylenebutenolidase